MPRYALPPPPARPILAAVVALSLAGRRREPSRADDPDGDELDSVDRGSDVRVIAIEDAIDLHGFQPREIPDVVESYLEAAVEHGLTEVRLIHGRGKGVQRQRVREVLERHPDVVDFGDAPAHRGGWGATIAWLAAPSVDVPTNEPSRDPPTSP